MDPTWNGQTWSATWPQDRDGAELVEANATGIGIGIVEAIEELLNRARR